MRYVALCGNLAAWAAMLGTAAANGAAAPDDVRALEIKVLAGEGAFNDVKLRRAQNIQVEVDDQNGNPVKGATVAFRLPYAGAGGFFGQTDTVYTASTGTDGRAATEGLRPNGVEGRFNVAVRATYNGLTAQVVVAQSNTLAGGQVGSADRGHKKYWILGLLGGAAAGGVLAATHHGGSPAPAAAPPATPTSISIGGISVGAPR